MKKIILAIILLLFCVTSAFGAADPNATAKTQALLAYLQGLGDKATLKILSGQYEEESTSVDASIAEVYSVTGRYPALIGRDFVIKSASSQTGSMISYNANNGVVQVGVHFKNPINGGSASLSVNNQPIADLGRLLPGGDLNTTFNGYLDTVAAALQTLEDANVPVIFRPFHEMNTTTFWWGCNSYSSPRPAAQYVNLWIYTFNYLTTTKGLHNLLWAYSAHFYPTSPIVTYYYPGAGYVDITGLDFYVSTAAGGVNGLSNSAYITKYNALVALGHPFAITELGACNGTVGDGTDESCPVIDYAGIINAISTYYPKSVYWMTWSWCWRMGRHSNISAVLNSDAKVITRDEVSYYSGTTYQLAVSKTGTGTGTVTSNPSGINCGSICSYNFASGQSIVLYASPTSGHTFVGWSGGGCSGTGTCTVNMTAATTVTAAFSAPATATTWYVDKDATGANNGTSWANAWKTFSAITWGTGGVQAGHILYISGGSTSKTYTVAAHGVLAPTVSGTSDTNRITIKVGQESPHNGQVIIDGGGTSAGVNLAYKSWITVDGEVSGSRKMRVTNGPMFPWQASIIYMPGGGTSSRATGLKLSYLEIDKGCDGVNARYNKYLEIDHCYIHDIRGDAAIAATAGEGGWGDIKIHHNTIVTNKPAGEGYGPDGITITFGGDIYNNTIYSTEGAVVGHSNIGTPHTLVYPDTTDCSGISYCYQHVDLIQATGKRMRIYNNKFFYGGNSIYYRSTAETEISDLWFCNNVFSQPGLWGIVLDYRNDATKPTSFARIYIINNTFTDHSTHEWGTINSLVSGATITDVQIKNNIFYNSGVDRAYNDRISTSQCASLYAGGKVSNNVVHAGLHGEAGWQCNYGNYASPCVNCTFNVAPLFTSYSEYNINSDLTLASGDTAARGKGVNLTTLLATAGLPSADIVGTGRPASGAWDVGAYQYGTPSLDTTAPTVPTNLNATALSYPQINLYWTASTDNVGVTGYRIFRCVGFGCTPTVQIAVTASTSYQDTNLSPSTVYVYGVKAFDAAGNVSAMSDTDSDTTPAADTNIALGGTVTSSSEESGSYLDDYAIDGSLTTRWSTAFSDPQWIKIDLGSTYTINKVILRWEAAYGKDYTIAVSEDDAEWTTAYTRTGGSGGTETITLTPVSARYVRMLGTARGTAWGYSLYEFEVYGTAEEEEPPQTSQNIEIEKCVLTPPVVSAADELASGGYYVKTDTAASGTAVCTFTIDTTGWYKFAVMSYGANSGTDSFTVEVDSVGSDAWHFNPTADPAHYGVYREDEINRQGTGSATAPQYDPYLVYLTAGEHTITFTGREAGARIDYFRPVGVSVTEQYTLTYTKAGSGSGTVVINGVNCSNSCQYNYNAGTPITITGTAGGDSMFTGWSGGICEGTDPCSFNMTEARAVTGTFDLLPPLHTITITPAGTGLGTVTSSPTGISCGSTCEFNFTENTTIRLTPAANAGSTFTGWTGDCSGSTYYDVEDIDDDVDCTATFARTTAPTTGTNFTLIFGGSVSGAAKITLVK